MKLSILFGQRKEKYEGEFAPEALLVWDEYTRDENHEAFSEEVARVKAEHLDQMQTMKVIEIDVDQDRIRRILIEAPVLKGTIQETP